MPGKQVRSELFKKLGTRLQKAHELHKGDETEFSSFGELPPGIKMGIAQLVECKFDVYKKGDFVGEYFFHAAGTVHIPLYHDGIKTEGGRTSITEPLCDTPNKSRKTIEEHIGWVYNELRKMGIDTEDIDPTNLDEVASDLKQMKPFFRFETWQGEATEQYPNPRTNHKWLGMTEYDPEEDAGAATEDSSEEVEEQPTPTPPSKTQKNGKASSKSATPTQVAKNGAASTKTAPAKGKKATPTPPPEPEEEGETAGEFNEFEDMDSLVAAANKGNDDAQQKLTDLATEAGVDQQFIDDAPNWEAVVAKMNNPDEEEGEVAAEEPVIEEEEPEVEATPEKGQLYAFKPLDQKTKKRATKAIEVEVVAVDTTKKTVTLKSLDNPKLTYAGVKWELLNKIGG